MGSIPEEKVEGRNGFNIFFGLDQVGAFAFPEKVVLFIHGESGFRFRHEDHRLRIAAGNGNLPYLADFLDGSNIQVVERHGLGYVLINPLDQGGIADPDGLLADFYAAVFFGHIACNSIVLMLR